MEILVTGFGKFPGVRRNPSAEIARQSGFPFRILPVTFDAADEFINEIKDDPPKRLLMLGVAPSSHMRIETVARNGIHGRRDQSGEVRFGPIADGEALTLESTLWTPKLCAEFSSGLHRLIRTSDDAGLYLCNYVYYQALRKLDRTQCGFLHVCSPKYISVQAQKRRLNQLISAVLSV